MENEMYKSLSTQNSVLEPEDGYMWRRILVGGTMSVIIVLGTVGNVLSLLVWIKVHRCKTSTACFLAALAVADLFVLLTAGLNFWISDVLLFDIRFTSKFACKGVVYLGFACQFISAWIIALVTIERAIGVWLPQKYKMICRPRIALTVIAVAVLCLLILCTPFLISADIVVLSVDNSSVVKLCHFEKDSTLDKDEDTWFYLEILFHFILPFIIIILSNSSILVKILLLAINRRRSFRNRTLSKDGKMFKIVTIRVLVLSVVFCLGVGPIHLYGYKKTLLDEEPKEVAIRGRMDQTVAYTCFVILMYLNNAGNFFLYCLIGSGFRDDVVKLFRRRTSQNIQPQVHALEDSGIDCQPDSNPASDSTNLKLLTTHQMHQCSSQRES